MHFSNLNSRTCWSCDREQANLRTESASLPRYSSSPPCHAPLLFIDRLLKHFIYGRALVGEFRYKNKTT